MTSEIKVRGYHTDLYRHVNNARYLEFLEEARWQLFDDTFGLERFFTQGYFFIVVNINISYKSPAAVNHLLSIHTALSKVSARSAVLKQTVYNQTTGQTCAEADVTFVLTDANGTVLTLEGALKEILAQLPKEQPIQES